MRLGDCLVQADTLLLREIASNYQMDCSLNSKNELITTLLQTFRTPVFVKTVLAHIREQGMLDVYMQLALHPRDELTREELVAITNRASTKYPAKFQAKKPMLNRLLQQGMIYPLGNWQALTRYVIPEEIRKQLKLAVTEQMKASVTVIKEDPVIWRDEKGALVRDIILFLQKCEKSLIKLTVDGALFKKQFSSIMQLLEVQESPVSGTGWRFGYGRTFHLYPDRFAFLYDYCYMRGLIEENLESGKLLVTNRAKMWMAEPEETRQNDLVKAYGLMYRRPIPRLNFIVRTLQALCENNWVTVQSLKEVVRPYLNAYYFDTEDTLFERRIISMLVHLGVVQLGSTQDGLHVVRTCSDVLQEQLLADDTQTLEPQPHLFIQPNFELLVPREFANAFGNDLEEMAELRSADAMRVYRITKQSVVRAIRIGWTEQSILGFLDRASGGLFPVNVRRMIEKWMEEYGNVTLYKTAVMECKTPEIAEEILHLPGIKSEVWGRIGDRHLLIREEAFEHVSESLEQYGYLPDVWN